MAREVENEARRRADLKAVAIGSSASPLSPWADSSATVRHAALALYRLDLGLAGEDESAC